ncbi:phenoloxidase 2-like, partial [Musca vetustissima]|uniref:phenoloxidase 2-like n=1 Tax=Musca vetustissima TaxID=27455 RepID=UPI002AB7E0EA
MLHKINEKALKLLFDRPLEPVFTARDGGKAIFLIPKSFYSEEYADISDKISTRFGKPSEIKMQIPVRDLEQKPDLTFARKIGKRSQFSLSNRMHQDIAAQLIKIFVDASNEDVFISTCVYCKDRVNPFLFQYCLSVAVQHREDTKEFPIKPIAETFPQHFVEPYVFHEARAESELIKDQEERRYVDIPLNFTASNREKEQRLAYFREDIGVNSHHWHWHLVYPGYGPLEIVKKDRRGELFYYMHHQVLARYNAERFSNNLAKLRPIKDLRYPIAEGYFPKIMNSSIRRTYPGRNANSALSDIDRNDIHVDIADIRRWIDRVVAAIDKGYVVDSKGNEIPLDPKKGIDILGDIVEATSLSVNPEYYGSLHNEGHNIIALCHDPEARFLEEFGVMGDNTTAMRDPTFYRWHGFVDEIFNRHKERLNPYDTNDLAFKGVEINNLEVTLTSGDSTPNQLFTRFEKSELNLAAGLDFGPEGNVYAKFTHLQHSPFEYKIGVSNNRNSPVEGTCRIFLCPKSDERGCPLKLNEQRLLAIEMDKFKVTLKPGVNRIYQLSSNSSVTIPYERAFPKDANEKPPQDLEQLWFCGCGWPRHMLLPKGKPEGMPFDLFVMISDMSGDAVTLHDKTANPCNDSASYCGLKDQLYPDNRSMGYPFDRKLIRFELNL